jgi:hypothetical protein
VSKSQLRYADVISILTCSLRRIAPPPPGPPPPPPPGQGAVGGAVGHIRASGQGVSASGGPHFAHDRSLWGDRERRSWVGGHWRNSRIRPPNGRPRRLLLSLSLVSIFTAMSLSAFAEEQAVKKPAPKTQAIQPKGPAVGSHPPTGTSRPMVGPGQHARGSFCGGRALSYVFLLAKRLVAELLRGTVASLSEQQLSDSAGMPRP